jgi:hypothetical protein
MLQAMQEEVSLLLADLRQKFYISELWSRPQRVFERRKFALQSLCDVASVRQLCDETLQSSVARGTLAMKPQLAQLRFCAALQSECRSLKTERISVVGVAPQVPSHSPVFRDLSDTYGHITDSMFEFEHVTADEAAMLQALYY